MSEKQFFEDLKCVHISSLIPKDLLFYLSLPVYDKSLLSWIDSLQLNLNEQSLLIDLLQQDYFRTYSKSLPAQIDEIIQFDYPMKLQPFLPELCAKMVPSIFSNFLMTFWSVISDRKKFRSSLDSFLISQFSEMIAEIVHHRNFILSVASDMVTPVVYISGLSEQEQHFISTGAFGVKSKKFKISFS